MRLFPRVVSTLLLAVTVVTCSDSPTRAARVPLRIGFAPRLSDAAEAIYRNLASFAITLDNVHVVVRTAPPGDQLGAVLADTTIAFPPSADQVTIAIDLTIDGSEQSVAASIELRDGTMAFFQGAQSLVATRGETTAAPEPVVVSYVGPGASAASIDVAPQPSTLAPSTSFLFSARVLDAAQQPITGLPITWTTGDASIATVSATGLVTSGGKLGTTTLTAKGLNGASGQATINVEQVATLVVVQGENQVGIVGTGLPVKLQVKAVDASGSAVIGATIDFSAVNCLGAVSPESATTDVNGLASTTMTLGQSLGSYGFTALAAGSGNVQTRVSATATAAAAASLNIVGGNNQADTVRAILSAPLLVKVADAFGNPVLGQAVTFQVTSGRAFLAAGAGVPPVASLTVTTGSDGVAPATLIADTLAGTVRVGASLTQSTIAPALFTATVKPGVATRLVILQQPSAAAQATIALGEQPQVQIADQFGNAVPMAGIDVSVAESCLQCLRVSRAGGAPSLNRSRAVTGTRVAPQQTQRLSSAPARTSRVAIPIAIARTQSISDSFPRGVGGKTSAVTDASGVARFSDLTLNESVGPWELEFFTPSQSLAAVFSNVIQLSPGPAASMIAWSLADTTSISLPGDTLYPSVRVIDEVGNGIPNVKVTWNATDKLSTFDNQTTTVSTQTDTDGFAVLGAWVTLVGAAGPFFIDATASGLILENAPLRFWAFVAPIGRVLPATPVSPPKNR